jgi:DNA-binding protein H-NS
VKVVSLFLILGFSGVLRADVTGASEAAIYSQLVTLVEQTKTQLEEMRKTYNVTEQMKDMQQNELVRDLSEAGTAFNGMFNDIQSIQGNLEDWRADPAGIATITRDIDRLEAQIERADGQEGLDKGQSYSQLLRSLKTIKWLGEAQADAERRMAEGTSEKDEAEIAASAMLSANKILIEQEKRKAREDAISHEIVSDMIKGVNYNGLGLMPKED